MGNRYGPAKIPSHVKSTVRIDYQPHVCKDYKETGFCGFGDSCIFLHDRGDYKMSWELEQDEILVAAQPDPSPKEEQACFLCSGNYQNPVETLCKHRFCESCILAHYSRNPKCPKCLSQLRGRFVAARIWENESLL